MSPSPLSRRPKNTLGNVSVSHSKNRYASGHDSAMQPVNHLFHVAMRVPTGPAVRTACAGPINAMDSRCRRPFWSPHDDKRNSCRGARSCCFWWSQRRGRSGLRIWSEPANRSGHGSPDIRRAACAGTFMPGPGGVRSQFSMSRTTMRYIESSMSGPTLSPRISILIR